MCFCIESFALFDCHTKALEFWPQIALCVDWIVQFSELLFHVSSRHYVSFSFSVKIPEAYFIRDPHTFLLTKDFVKVPVLYPVLKVFSGL